MSAKHPRQIPSILVLALLISAGLSSQTKVEAPRNKYDPADDVKLGRQAAAEVEKEFPLLEGSEADRFIEQVGRRLVETIPAEFRHPEFDYSFDVVNASDINAFALPGGPLYFNRGMIEAAKTEGEVAGVVAHEMAHVALRHGTAQATEATKYQIGQIAGAILGEIVGGTAGSIISQGSRLGIGAAFLRFGREYEKQADLLGAQMMARAGYRPREMASMFETIARETGRSGPEWLSDHPNPGNRAEYITEEARSLQVADRPEVGNLQQVQARLGSLPDAPTTEEILKDAERRAQAGGSGGTEGARGTSGISKSVEPPSRDFRTYSVGDLFSVSVPANWRQVQGPQSVRYAPPGGFGQVNGQEVFTHGVEIGAVDVKTGDLRQATTAFIQAIGSANQGLRVVTPAREAGFAGQNGLRTELANPSRFGGTERVTLRTAMVDGRMLYSIAVVPEREYDGYRSTIERVNGSVRLRR